MHPESGTRLIDDLTNRTTRPKLFTHTYGEKVTF